MTDLRENGSKARGISGSTLKLIAMCVMLLDHVAAGILGRYLTMHHYQDAVLLKEQGAVEIWIQQNDILFYTYLIMRFIGRISFPIYCFLLVEGFQKTHDSKKYLFRLGIFAILSEIPFDLTFWGKTVDFTYQNVFMTLFIGMLTMIAFDYIAKHFPNQRLKVLLSVLALLVFAGAAEYLKTDYGAIGVLCIMVLYIFRNNKKQQIKAGCLAFLWEVTAPLAFIPIHYYNGRRGLKLKIVFYLFYPLHLLLIYLICIMLGIDGITAVV